VEIFNLGICVVEFSPVAYLIRSEKPIWIRTKRYKFAVWWIVVWLRVVEPLGPIRGLPDSKKPVDIAWIVRGRSVIDNSEKAYQW
jgi:hypothetical protein